MIELVQYLPSVLVGFVSGVLSGAFGIGGGIVMSPSIKLLLGGSALAAVATPLVAIVPSAVTGSYAYIKRGVTDVRIGAVVGACGMFFGPLGALAASRVGGNLVLMGTSALILYVAGDTIWGLMQSRQARAKSQEKSVAAAGVATEASSDAVADAATEASSDTAVGVAAEASSVAAATPYVRALGIGVVAGFFSGFFGLGGGFIIVPLLVRILKMNYKQAIGTSLMAVALVALPSLLTHAYLGNVDWVIGAGLVVGVVPGAAIGAKITLGASERIVRILFACLLIVVGLWLLASTMNALG